ncbi:MAG: hypothetical protein ABIS59_02280 [Candidatus Saccharibacteria bacterium]
MNPQVNPTPEQQPGVPMAEIPQAPENVAPAASSSSASAVTPAQAADAVAAVAATDMTAVSPTAATANPIMAADIDVIEKEWVDKTEAIIAKTAGDPHAEEEAVEDLQIDYMKKRYGKDIQKSGDK